MKCAFLQSDLDEQHVDDNDDEDFKIESAQPVSRTNSQVVSKVASGASPIAAWSTLLEDGITELPPIFEKWEVKNLSWHLACGLTEATMVLLKTCVWYVLMTSCCL